LKKNGEYYVGDYDTENKVFNTYKDNVNSEKQTADIKNLKIKDKVFNNIELEQVELFRCNRESIGA
jgi:hypothetical protein